MRIAAMIKDYIVEKIKEFIKDRLIAFSHSLKAA
jgi:hypothetical protein